MDWLTFLPYFAQPPGEGVTMAIFPRLPLPVAFAPEYRGAGVRFHKPSCRFKVCTTDPVGASPQMCPDCGRTHKGSAPLRP